MSKQLRMGYNPKQKIYKVYLRKPIRSTKYGLKKVSPKKAQENIARSFLKQFGHPKHNKAKLKLVQYKKQSPHPKNWKLFKIKILTIKSKKRKK